MGLGVDKEDKGIEGQGGTEKEPMTNAQCPMPND
jgi:hypothetical protein